MEPHPGCHHDPSEGACTCAQDLPANEALRESAYKQARGELHAPPKPYWCLKQTRLVVEDALFGGRYALYDRYLVAGTSFRTGRHVGRHRLDPWASDLEASVKRLGLAVPFEERRAGDLIFDHTRAKPQGHVGVLIERDLVLENADPAWRPHSIVLGPALVLTPVEHFARTLVARLVQEPVRDESDTDFAAEAGSTAPGVL